MSANNQARDGNLLLGPFTAACFAIGVTALPYFVPGYDPVRQTVSEIGEIGSPMRWQFAVMLWMAAAGVLAFAAALWKTPRTQKRGVLDVIAVFCTAWMGVAAAALGFFAFPHPLHNLFGISELIAYQAPLFFALAWMREPSARGAVVFSVIMYVLTLVSLGVNLTAIGRDNIVWQTVQPYYGLVQRSLFACFFAWIAGAGWLLCWRRA